MKSPKFEVGDWVQIVLDGAVIVNRAVIEKVIKSDSWRSTTEPEIHHDTPVVGYRTYPMPRGAEDACGVLEELLRPIPPEADQSWHEMKQSFLPVASR